MGPVYTAADTYQRVLLHPSPQEPNLRIELLALMGQLNNGELDQNSRTFHLALIQHVGDLEIEEAITDLVDLACAPLGSNALIDPEAHPETMAVRVEFRRLAALKALRQIIRGTTIKSTGRELHRSIHRELHRYRESGQPEQIARADFAWEYVTDYRDP